MDIVSFVVDKGLIMIPVLFIIGFIISNTKILDNKWIPVILILISMGFTPAVLGAYNPDNFVQAVLVAGATVLGDQVYKQLKQ